MSRSPRILSHSRAEMSLCRATVALPGPNCRLPSPKCRSPGAGASPCAAAGLGQRADEYPRLRGVPAIALVGATCREGVRLSSTRISHKPGHVGKLFFAPAPGRARGKGVEAARRAWLPTGTSRTEPCGGPSFGDMRKGGRERGRQAELRRKTGPDRVAEAARGATLIADRLTSGASLAIPRR